MGANVKNYTEQGGARRVVASGGSIDIESGGEIDIESGADLKLAGTKVTPSAADFNHLLAADANGLTAADLTKLAGLTASDAEINELDGMIASLTFAFAAGAANIVEVTITFKDADGVTVASPSLFTLWLSDAATGVALTGTSASGTVQAKSGAGADFEVLTAKKALKVQALATGIYILEITDSGKTAFYIAAQTPHGEVKVSAQLAGGDYGA